MKGDMILSTLKIILSLAGGLFLFTFMLLVRNTYLPRYQYTILPSQYGMTYEEVDFLSSDKKRLRGWLIIKDKKSSLIILCHGLGTNKSDLMHFAHFLYQADFNIFMFDFRGHGESSGKATSFGYWEQRDLKGAIEYLNNRDDLPNADYGVFGISMGGSVAILVAAKDTSIKAVAVDSPYADLEESIARHLKLMYHLPRFPLANFTILAYRLRFLTNSKEISPLRVINKISPRAVFLINGAEDMRMLASAVRKLYRKAEEHKELWLVPNAAHLESYAVAGKEYEEKLVNFFNSYLR